MKNFKNNLKKGAAAVSTALISTVGYVNAAGVDDVVKPMNNLQTLLTTIATGIGGVWLLISVIQFAFAFNQNDSAGKQSAIKGMVAGGILLSAGIVITFLTT